jgi:hypothetical protein
MEKVFKLCCQDDNFKTMALGKIDSSFSVYILFEYSRLKIAVNRLQFIL